MPEVTATEAARNFSELLDAVEHSGEYYTIIRHGRAIAQIEPIGRGRGAETKTILRRHRPDPAWSGQLAELRGPLEIRHRT